MLLLLASLSQEQAQDEDHEKTALSGQSLQVYRLAVADLSLPGLSEKQALLQDLLTLNPEVVLLHLGALHVSLTLSFLLNLSLIHPSTSLFIKSNDLPQDLLRNLERRSKKAEEASKE